MRASSLFSVRTLAALLISGLLLPRFSPAQSSTNSNSPFPRDAEAPLTLPPMSNTPVHSPGEGSNLVVFFPPAAPVYGRPLPSNSSTFTFNGRSVDAPDGLGKYVGEYFYPPLSTRLYAGKLAKKDRARLEAYWANRRMLLHELLDVLVSLQVADPTTRERELRAFAALQTPLIAAHEKEGEALRESLIRGGGFGSASVDWSQDREWKFGGENPPKPPVKASAEMQVIRAAAYYQKGLTIEQRGLICEIVEQERRSPLPARFRSLPDGNTDRDVVFFSPETARIKLPELPNALNAQIAAYVRTKTELKQELRDAIIANDASGDGKRNAVFSKLADRQWPRLAALEAQADEIRRELAVLPAPPPPAFPPKIPAGLAARMEECQKERNALEAERVAYYRNASSQALQSPADDGKKPSLDQQRERMARVRSELIEINRNFHREHADRYAALDEKLKAVAADLDHFAKTNLDSVTGDPMDAKILLARIGSSDRYFDQLAREDVLYKNYRIAMLELGLSPEQRRLLFNLAREELAQSLPHGELFPRGRMPLPFF